MGFIKNKEGILRRIDIRFVSFENYYSSLLYFTGSADLNRKMRNVAKKKGYKLSEYGLTNINNNSEKIVINSEKDIFDFLNLEYLKPNER
jgi:DNA polymerase/3'-5' exonuclease PolX